MSALCSPCDDKQNLWCLRNVCSQNNSRLYDACAECASHCSLWGDKPSSAAAAAFQTAFLRKTAFGKFWIEANSEVLQISRHSFVYFLRNEVFHTLSTKASHRVQRCCLSRMDAVSVFSDVHGWYRCLMTVIGDTGAKFGHDAWRVSLKLWHWSCDNWNLVSQKVTSRFYSWRAAVDV